MVESVQTGKICSFFGRRNVGNEKEIYEKLLSVVAEKIEEGFTVFYFGDFGDFDTLSFEAVKELKKKYDAIKLVICYGDEYTARKRKCYDLEKGYDEALVVPLRFGWWYTRLYYRNLSMIDYSDFCVFYADPSISDSGASKALRYAVAQKKPFINLFGQ